MFNGDGKHQCASASALSHLAGGVRVAFHKRHNASRSQGAVFHRTTARTDVAEVVSHAAAAFHQLHLLLVDFHNAAIRVAVAAVANNKTVRQRNDLKIIADTRHRAALGDDVAEIFEQTVYLLLAHRIGVFAFDARKFRCDATVHHIRVEFENDVAVAQCVFVHPYVGCQFVTVKVFHRRFHNVFRQILFVAVFYCFAHSCCADCVFFRCFFI